MLFNSKSLCVYHHKANGEVFYVGMGAINRPFNASLRNKAWEAIVKLNKGDFTIEIVQVFNSLQRADAKRFERQEIMRLKPIANLKLM